jgi:chromosome segregation ATPase
MSVTAQTVLSALEKLQESYVDKKNTMNNTLNKILAETKTIEYCVSNLITNFGDKAELSSKLDEAKKSYNTAKTQANVSEEELKKINEKVTELKTEIDDKEEQNIKLLKKIEDATHHMKSMCSIGSSGKASAELKVLEDERTRINDKIDNLDKKKMVYKKQDKIKRLRNELDEVEKKIRTFTQTVVSEGESKFKEMITALKSIYGSFPEDDTLKQILNETDDSEVERLMNPILKSLVLTEEEKTKLLETAKNFMSNKANPATTQPEQKAETSEVNAEGYHIIPTEDNDYEFGTARTIDHTKGTSGGYKHSSRKSRSKSTRKRVKNKFKKIKIFSKKRSRKKKK